MRFIKTQSNLLFTDESLALLALPGTYKLVLNDGRTAKILVGPALEGFLNKKHVRFTLIEWIES